MLNPDVLVIGAGPAGSVSAALLHKAGFKVRVVEKEKFPRFVIGESLLPRCMEVLDACGLIEAIKRQGYQEKFGAKFVRGTEKMDFNFSDGFTPGWGWTWQVPRADFDLTLINEVRSWGVPVDFETAVTGITFFEDETSETTIQKNDGTTEVIRARFIIDASGYGRVIPRLFNLDKPSTLPARKAVFAHIEDPLRNNYQEPNRIIILSYAPGVWAWIIPFSTGITSLGFVGPGAFFETYEGELTAQFNALINGLEFLKSRFSTQKRIFEPRKLEGWSTKTERFFGNGFVLTGNVTEFLDPIFSSGVMFATVSSHLATTLAIRKLKGDAVDWQKEYTETLQGGVDTFKVFVNKWYDGTLEKIFYYPEPDEQVQKQICSILAGYVWDANNPFASDPEAALNRVSAFIDFKNRMG